MTPDKLKEILAGKENMQVEFKESTENLARSVYETICAFLNRRGGHVILGATDSGKIKGINPEKVQDQLDILAKDTNNPQLFNPTVFLEYEPLEVDGKKVIYFYVPESRQAHSYKGIYYDRNQDGDFALRGTEMIANLFIRKSKHRTENNAIRGLSLEDLDNATLDLLRRTVTSRTPGHAWSTASNEEILKSGEMIVIDPETGKHEYSLAALLLFGTEPAIRRHAPQYRIDVLCRINDTMLYDDRLILKCNLVTAYRQITEFVAKHMPEQPFIGEDLIRISLRDTVLREVTLNLLIHAEYSNYYPSTFTIYRDHVIVENWNIPYQYGNIDLSNTKPHRKNPVIANVFSHIGIVEELGSGMKKIFKYTPLLSGGKNPVITEDDVYHIEIPYQPTLQASSQKSGEKSGEKSETKEKNWEKTLRLMSENPSITTADLIRITGLSSTGIEKIITKLKADGKIMREGPAKGGHWIVIEK